MSGLRRRYRKDDVWIRLCQLFKGESGQLPVRNRQDRGCLIKGSTGKGTFAPREDGRDQGICGEDRHEVRRAAEADAGRADRI